MTFSIDSEDYQRGLRYEVLDKCITIEMAWHQSRRYEIGKDNEQGRLHSAAMTALYNLSESLHVDYESIERGRRIFREMKAKRKAGDIAAVAESINTQRKTGGE